MELNISHEVEEIIEYLIGKFGVSIDYLFPKIVEYGKTASLFYSIIFLLPVLLMTFAISLIILKKNSFKINDAEEAIQAIIILFIILLPFLGFGLYNLYNYIMWVKCPEIQAIKYVQNLLR